MSKLSQSQVDQLVEWREAGRSQQWIATKLGLTASGVYYHCLRNGFSSARRLARGRNSFTPQEDELLLARRVEGATIAAIACELKRPESSVFMRLQILSARDDTHDPRTNTRD